MSLPNMLYINLGWRNKKGNKLFDYRSKMLAENTTCRCETWRSTTYHWLWSGQLQFIDAHCDQRGPMKQNPLSKLDLDKKKGWWLIRKAIVVIREFHNLSKFLKIYETSKCFWDYIYYLCENYYFLLSCGNNKIIFLKTLD